jgi:isopenicillin-N N-acyltransferase-like protein
MEKEYPPPRVVRVRGSSREMGRQHGEQLKDLLLQYRTSTESSYKRVGYVGERLAKTIALNEEALERVLPQLMEELHGIAEGAKIPYDDILSMYLCPEIVSAQPLDVVYQRYYREESQKGCTSFAACAKATKGGAPLLAQTRDTSPSGVEYRITVTAEPAEGYSYVAHSRPTLNGGYGVNSKGVSIAAPTVHTLDSVTAINSSKPSGITDSTLSKIVMEKCASIDDALEYAESRPGGYMGLNVLLVDQDGNMAKVERSYDSFNTSVPEKALYSTNFVMAATNHFSSEKMNRLGPSSERDYASSYHRYDRIMELLTSEAGHISYDVFEAFSRDHGNGPGDLSICRHGNSVCTNAAFIVELRKRRLHVLTGTPCQNNFVTFRSPD